MRIMLAGATGVIGCRPADRMSRPPAAALPTEPPACYEIRVGRRARQPLAHLVRGPSRPGRR